MDTPIHDFVKSYAQSAAARFHMPGHKGVARLGCEPLDITEIPGADELYAPGGIIAQSEANAAALFGARQSFYSTEGSSQCIRAMLYLARLGCPDPHPTVLAGRNAHKTFLYACALSDLAVDWLAPPAATLCACPITAAELETALSRRETPPCAVYLTSPDYLGSLLDIAALSAVCRRHGVPLLVDNAHGAYLRFLPTSLHPLDLGADLCCDSAHKTLPVLTGGATLHVGRQSPFAFADEARQALALFGSTSPSYLILQSLDLCNRYLADHYPCRLAQCRERLDGLRLTLESRGLALRPSEPLKLVFAAAEMGATGPALAEILRQGGVECEYAEEDFLVLMATPDNSEADFARLEAALGNFRPRPPRPAAPPLPPPGQAVLTPRQALFAPHERLTPAQALGRVCASPTVSCPPAIPIAVSGELLGQEQVETLTRYGVEWVEVVKD